MGDSYADPRFGVPKQSMMASKATINSATVRVGQWTAPRDEKGSTANAKVLRVGCIINTAGTSTGSNSLLQVFNATTSIGVLTIDSATVDTVVYSGALNATISSGVLLNVRNSGSDAVAVITPFVEYVEQFKA